MSRSRAADHSAPQGAAQGGGGDTRESCCTRVIFCVRDLESCCVGCLSVLPHLLLYTSVHLCRRGLMNVLCSELSDPILRLLFGCSYVIWCALWPAGVWRCLSGRGLWGWRREGSKGRAPLQTSRLACLPAVVPLAPHSPPPAPLRFSSPPVQVLTEPRCFYLSPPPPPNPLS